MKYLKIIDFAAQSLLWGSMIGFASLFALAGRQPEAALLPIALGLLGMGGWQMGSSLLLILLTTDHRKKRCFHFITASIYLLVLVFASNYKVEKWFSAPVQHLVAVLAVAVPIGLAIFYSSITWVWMFPKRATGKFLPHTSF